MKILEFLPRKSLSRTVGRLAASPWTGAFGAGLIKAFAQRYQINVSEAEKPIEAYSNLNDFFTRRLKAGVRPLGTSALVHCADAKITQAGRMQNGQLIQAKGKKYSLENLIFGESSVSIPHYDWAEFERGSFITYYLCPTDYHRVHSPAKAKILSVSYVCGDLWPVNDWSTENVPRLFEVNERVAMELQTSMGRLWLVMVGATNVGQISLSFDPSFRTNSKKEGSKVWVPDGSAQVEKGEELGIFHMGSTVVLVFDNSFNFEGQDLSNLKSKMTRVRANIYEN